VLSKQTFGRTVAVVALLLLAGCAGLNGATETTTAPEAEPSVTAETTTAVTEVTTTTETSTETTTTTETPTEAPTTTATGPETGSNGSALPPGVSGSALENATAVVAAHNESVLERGAVTSGETNLTGTLSGEAFTSSVDETVRLAPGATEMRWTVLGNTTRGNETTRLNERYYANESTFFSRVERAGEVSVRAVDRSSVLDGLVRNTATKLNVVNATLSNANYTVANVTERDGRTLTTLVSVNGTYNGRQSRIVAFEASVTVSESGRVLSLTRSWTREAGNTTNSYAETIEWSNARPVERPDWTTNATAAVERGDVSDDRTSASPQAPSEVFSSTHTRGIAGETSSLVGRYGPARNVVGLALQ
jgi:hypothetical protein